MSSVTDIANLALVPLLGCNRINNIEDEQTEAIVMKAAYIYCRDAVMEERAWTFATGRATWTPTANVPPFGFSAEYLMPSTVMRVLRIETLRGVTGKDWVVETNGNLTVLLANDPALNVKYIEKVDNTNRFSAGFINCLAIYLAWFTCIGLTENRSLQDSLWVKYQDALTEAASSDGQQGKSRVTTANTLLKAR
jgi:hypothetical protein